MTCSPALGALALTWVLASGCSREKAEEATVAVQIAPVRKITLQHNVTSEALLFPLQQAALTPKISAPVKEFLVKRGSRVRKGQLLAVLENRDLAAAAQENKGAFEQAEAAYETTTAASLPEEIEKAKLDAQASKEALDAAQKVLDSRQELFRQGAIPRREVDQAGVNLAQARAQSDVAQTHLNALLAVGRKQELKSAAGQLESAKGKYLGARAQLGYSEIRSPIDGFVTDRPLYSGEMAAAGTPLITVMDLSQVIARAHIPQEQAALLKVGDSATIAVAGEEDSVPGKITVVSPALDPNSTTVEVWVQARNPRQQLRPGSSVQVSMTARTIPNALVVPASSLLTDPDGATSVMVLGADSRAHRIAVKTGIKEGDDLQILDGLKGDEKVISSGNYGLPDKTKVSIEAPSRAKDGTPSPQETHGDEK